MNYLHQPKSEHHRRTLLNSALGEQAEFLAPDSDKDCQVRIPFGKYEGLTIGQILEADPAYLRWPTTDATLREGPFTEALSRVAARYQDRINTAQRKSRRY